MSLESSWVLLSTGRGLSALEGNELACAARLILDAVVAILAISKLRLSHGGSNGHRRSVTSDTIKIKEYDTGGERIQSLCCSTEQKVRVG